MSFINFEPSLWLLIAKVPYFLLVASLTGWAVFPGAIFEHSRVATWVFRQSLGTGLLLLIGFNLVSFDIPAQWLVIAPPLLLGLRYLINWLYPRKDTTYSASSDSLARSLVIYAAGSSFIVLIYLIPFIMTNSSGLYAYGGGDHSGYFRISDIAVHQSLKSLMISMGLAWPPTQDYTAMTLASSNMYPPAANWSINSFLFYIKYARQSWTFANQTIGVPFIALGFNNPEESFTAGISIYLLLLCWGGSLFAWMLMGINATRTSILAVAACAIALASPALSLVLKQTIPAVYAWSAMLIFLSALIYRNSEVHKQRLELPIPFGIAFASAYLMYLPAVLLVGPLWATLFLKNIKAGWGQKIKWAFLVLLVVLVSTNVEIDRPMKLFIANATGSVLDYGLQWMYLPIALFGVADFESILSTPIYYPLAYLAAFSVLVGLFFYVINVKQTKYLLVFLMPLLLAIAYYWLKGGHYHIIRMIEFLGVVLVAMSTIGFARAYISSKWWGALIISILVSIFLINAIIFKININKKIISSLPNPRGGIISAKMIKLAAKLEHKFNKHKSSPLVYWMGYGSIPFANNEVTFRKLKYVESFEYDYTYMKLDILEPEYLNDALLIYPKKIMKDILEVDPSVFYNKKSKIENLPVQTIGKDSGAAILGTGWMPTTLENNQPVRYLRSMLEGGLVVWSKIPKVVQIEIDASGVEPGMFLTLRRPEIENDLFSIDKSIFRGPTETAQAYFVRLKSTGCCKDIIYNLEDQFRTKMSLNSASFNAHLAASKIFKRFIIFNLEDNAALTKNLVAKHRSLQYTSELTGYHDKLPTHIKFNMNLHEGANVLRFIVRDHLGRRSGRDVVLGAFYNPTINTPFVIVKKIKISPLSEKLGTPL